VKLGDKTKRPSKKKRVKQGVIETWAKKMRRTLKSREAIRRKFGSGNNYLFEKGGKSGNFQPSAKRNECRGSWR